MMSIVRKVFEAANVLPEHPSGLVFPIGGARNYIDKSKETLAKLQDLSTKDPEEQAKIISRVRGF